MSTTSTGVRVDSGAPRPLGRPTELVAGARGLLAPFNRAGVLGYADVHVAQRLERTGGEGDDTVLLAAAFAVRAVRQGSSCLEVAAVADTVPVDGLPPEAAADLPWPDSDTWLRALNSSPIVACGSNGGADRPLRLVDGLLYLDRYWRQEQQVAEYVDAAMLAPAFAPNSARLAAALTRLFPDAEPDRQRLAAVVAAHRRFSVVAGGPGTGKTTTVARLLALLQDQADGRLRVALAAPTGKAAARLTEAAASASARLHPEDQERLGPLTASTLHRLLGSRRDQRTRFWHDRDNRLPYDVVVVDEASMVSLTMMARLLEAMRPTSRLVLVGDPDQLSSVEVGAVLGDLVARPAPAGVVPMAPPLAEHDLAVLTPQERSAAVTSGVVRLSTVHRFSGDIRALATAIRDGSHSGLAKVLDTVSSQIELVDSDSDAEPAGQSRVEAEGMLAMPAGMLADVREAGTALVSAARAGDAEAALDALDLHRVLCGHREGPYGVSWWAALVESGLAGAVNGYAVDGEWYVGRPLLVTSNDYSLRLFNGDTGVVVDVGGRPRAAFRRDNGLELVAVARLGDVATVHAMSVHRAQGSQFDRVTLVLPPLGSPLLTRELVYTAVTRAKEHVRIIGSRAALEAAISRPVQRASGLRTRVAGPSASG